MALFKILSNMDDSSKTLPSSYVKGYCYFDVRDGKFWIDTKDKDSTGRLAINAGVADAWRSARTITVNGDMSGSVSIDGSANKTLSIALNNTGVSAGTFGPTANATLTSSGTFVVPSFTVDSKGRITASDEYVFTLPAAAKVTLNGTETTAASFYAPITAGTSGQLLRSNGSNKAPDWITYNPVASINNSGYDLIYYLMDREPHPVSIKLNLNGSTTATTGTAFYAPTSIGESGQVITSNGTSLVWSDLSVEGLVHIGNEEPVNENYNLWVDTSEDVVEAMRADAIKYKTFSIATNAWGGSGPYTYTITALGVTENTAIINLTLDATSQTYQKAQLDWETGTNVITLSTATMPTGTIAGYLIATEVTEI